MKIVNEQEYYETIKSGLTLVDFYADWCGPCKMLAPILEEVSVDYPNIKFIKVNVDDCMEVAEKLGIMSIPQLYLFKDEKIIMKLTGYRDKSEVKAYIDEALKNNDN